MDAYAFHHSHLASRPNTETLEKALRASREAGLPEYALSPAQEKFLALHCRASSVTHALEIGTLGGYTVIWLASENPRLRLTTVKHNPQHVEVARKNIELDGLSHRAEMVHGAGLDVLARLRDEVRAGTRPPSASFLSMPTSKTTGTTSSWRKTWCGQTLLSALTMWFATAT